MLQFAVIIALSFWVSHYSGFPPDDTRADISGACASYGDDILYDVSWHLVGAATVVDLADAHAAEYLNELGSGCSLLFRNRSDRDITINISGDEHTPDIHVIGPGAGWVWKAEATGVYHWWGVARTRLAGTIIVR